MQERTELLDFLEALLDAITRHDGKLTWYQLDRAVVGQFPHLSSELMTGLADMQRLGLIEAVPNPQAPGRPFYRRRVAPRPPTS